MLPVELFANFMLQLKLCLDPRRKITYTWSSSLDTYGVLDITDQLGNQHVLNLSTMYPFG